MPKAKIAVTLEASLLSRLDARVSDGTFPTRSRAVEDAVRAWLDRLDRNRLARECAKLDPAFEKALADEGLAQDGAAWPEY